MSSLGSDYGIPSLRELEAFMMDETPYQPSAVQAAPGRRGSMGYFVLSPFERAKQVPSPLVRSTSTVAARVLTAQPSSRSSSAGSAFPVEPATERPALLVGKSIDPAYREFRPLPGYGEWIEKPDLNTPAVEAMKAEIVTVQKLVLSRGVSLHDISDAVQSGTSVQDLEAQTAKRVTFSSQIEQVIPAKNKRQAGCCVVQ
jgi:hypothetical protein